MDHVCGVNVSPSLLYSSVVKNNVLVITIIMTTFFTLGSVYSKAFNFTKK